MADPLTPDPNGTLFTPGDPEGAAQEVNSAVEYAHLSLQGAVNLARKAGNEAQELPGEALDAIEAGITRLKDEIERLRHVIQFNKVAREGIAATEQAQATLQTTTTPPAIGAEAPQEEPNA